MSHIDSNIYIYMCVCVCVCYWCCYFIIVIVVSSSRSSSCSNSSSRSISILKMLICYKSCAGQLSGINASLMRGWSDVGIFVLNTFSKTLI